MAPVILERFCVKILHMLLAVCVLRMWIKFSCGSPTQERLTQSDDVKPQDDDVLVRNQYSTRSRK
jgi:hypothetical protein